jgi:DNA-binding winged helix-turn-helix (wHTH) protein
MDDSLPSQRLTVRYEFEDLVIDLGKCELRRGDVPINLPRLSFDLLVALVRCAPNLVTYDELMKLVWSGLVVSQETITQRVLLVRDALGDDAGSPRYIEGVRGKGYRVRGKVRSLAAPLETMPLLDPLLAVLAFENLSNDPEMSYFSDGVAEEIQQTAARGSNLKIIGRASSFQFRGTEKAAANIASRLRATHVLDGSVRRQGAGFCTTRGMRERNNLVVGAIRQAPFRHFRGAG